MHLPRRFRGAMTAAIAVLALAAAAPSQEPEDAPALADAVSEEAVDAEPAPEAETAQDPQIDTGVLQARLRPMRKADVEAELESWLGILQAKAEEIAEAEVSRGAAEAAGNNEQVDRISERLIELRAERDRIKERVTLVMESATRKGSDVDEAQKYVASIAGLPQVTGFQSALAEAKAWLLSKEGGLALLIAIAQFVGVLIVFRILAGIIAGLIGRAVGRMKNASSLLREFVVGLTGKTIFLVGVVIALSYIGVNITPLVAAIGAAGLVIGLALQGTLSNFAAGLLILFYRPYDVGDFVTVGGVSGTVDSMNLMSTTVKTPDNQNIIIPNGSIWGDVITNVTANTTRRVDLKFGVSYTDDLDKVETVLRDVLESHPKVLKDPAVVVQVHELGDSSVNFIARPWVNAADYWSTYWDLQKQVKQRFDREGISIPFPQRDLHVYQVQSAIGAS